MGKRRRYRYILSGTVKSKDKISDFRLISKNTSPYSNSAIRVFIPDDMELKKWRCDNYSTTSDGRTLEELEYDVLIKVNGKFIKRNDLKKHEPHEYYEILINEGYLITPKLGYVAVEQYKICLQEMRAENK